MIWSIALIIVCVVWIVRSFLIYRTTRLVRHFGELTPREPEKWPAVSVISAACNEADALEDAVKSKLESDYPDFEIVLVDDRSTDGTGKIVDRLAENDSRIKAVHIDKLPDEWLGKPYALRRGVEVARGDWFLFTDADVHFSRDSIRKAVALCEDRKLDQLGALPNVWGISYLLNVVMTTFIRTYSFGAGFWGLDNPRVETFTGVGAFNLVRRSAYEKTDGFEWLKLDLADDVALARMIKRAGGKVHIVNAMRSLKVQWYKTVREMTVGLDRVAYVTLGDFTLWKTILFCLLFLGFELLPFLGLLFVGVPWLQWLCVFMVVLGLVNAIGMNLWANGPVMAAFLYPVGAIILAGIMLRGGWLGWRRRGIFWRGTFYSEETLKKGKRIFLP